MVTQLQISHPRNYPLRSRDERTVIFYDPDPDLNF